MQHYQPIDCDLYNELVLLAMRHQACTIVYRDPAHQKIILEDQIVDVYSQDKQEFLRLQSGTIIRLDTLIQVNQLRF
jgi:Rho-binding antiterminator